MMPIRELCRVAKGVDERIDKTVFRWFGHIEIMENDRIANRMYVRVCLGSCLVVRQQKRWIDSLNDSLKKRGLNGQAWRMVYDRNEWYGFLRENEWG